VEIEGVEVRLTLRLSNEETQETALISLPDLVRAYL